MSETTPAELNQELSSDDIRQHSQEPAEGPDIEPEFRGANDDSDDVPREHSQDPAEG